MKSSDEFFGQQLDTSSSFTAFGFPLNPEVKKLLFGTAVLEWSPDAWCLFLWGQSFPPLPISL